MLRRSIRLARLFGIDIVVTPLWFLLAALTAYIIHSSVAPTFDAMPSTPKILFSVMLTILLYISIVVHELAHAAVAKFRLGIDVPAIVLRMLSGTSLYRGEPERPGGALAIAVAGPVASFAVAVVALGALLAASWPPDLEAPIFVKNGTPSVALFTVWVVAFVNGIIFVVNLIPALPADGGSVVQAVFWWMTGSKIAGTKVAAWSGRIIAVGVLALSALAFQAGVIFGGIAGFLIALVLFQNASIAVRSVRMTEGLKNMSIRDLMESAPATVPGHLPVEAALRDIYLAQNRRSLPVVSLGGEYLGMVATDQILALPKVRWSETTMQALCRESNAEPNDTAIDVLAPYQEVVVKFQSAPVTALAVLEGGRLVGLLSRDRLFQQLGLSDSPLSAVRTPNSK